jgi:hypothetical protein
MPVFGKFLKTYLAVNLQDNRPLLDIVQNGFRQRQSTLDQVLCLYDISRKYEQDHHTPPVLAFLDIKSAYDTLNRNIIWKVLRDTTAPSYFTSCKISLIMYRCQSYAKDMSQNNLLLPLEFCKTRFFLRFSIQFTLTSYLPSCAHNT